MFWMAPNARAGYNIHPRTHRPYTVNAQPWCWSPGQHSRGSRRTGGNNRVHKQREYNQRQQHDYSRQKWLSTFCMPRGLARGQGRGREGGDGLIPPLGCCDIYALPPYRLLYTNTIRRQMRCPPLLTPSRLSNCARRVNQEMQQESLIISITATSSSTRKKKQREVMRCALLSATA